MHASSQRYTVPMTLQEENAIERYIIDPDAMPPDERAAVEACLQSDPAARAWADHLRSLYATAFDAPPSDAAHAFVDALYASPAVIHLHPVRRDHPSVATVAAADGRSPDAPAEGDRPEPHVVDVAVNTAEHVLVRVFRPTDAAPGRLYVLAERRPLWEHALVSLPALNIHVPTNDQGMGVLPAGITWSADLPPLELRPALSQAHLPAVPARTATLRFDSGHSFRLQRENDTLRIRLTTKPADAPVVQRVRVDVDATEPSAPRLAALHKGEGAVDLPAAEGPLTVRLYG